MFQLVENASADGDVDYYRFFQECKKCKNLGRKQISTRSRYFRCTKVCKDALSYVSSSVTSLMFQLVIMVIISLVSSSLLFTLHYQQQGLREEMTIGQWHHHTSPGAGSAYKSPPPYNRNPSAVALITFAGYICVHCKIHFKPWDIISAQLILCLVVEIMDRYVFVQWWFIGLIFTLAGAD